MMTGRESAGAPFDEQAALEELERLQHAIKSPAVSAGIPSKSSTRSSARSRILRPTATPASRRPSRRCPFHPDRSCAFAAAHAACASGSAAAPGDRRSTRPGAGADSRAAANWCPGAGCSTSSQAARLSHADRGTCGNRVRGSGRVFLLTDAERQTRHRSLSLRSRLPSPPPRRRWLRRQVRHPRPHRCKPAEGSRRES